VDISPPPQQVLEMMGLLCSAAKHLVRSMFGLEQPTERSINVDGARRLS
jgi:hypothetical protein